MVGARDFDRRCGFGASYGLSAKIIVCALGLSFALGAVKARAAQAALAGSVTQQASTARDAIRDLGALPPLANADNSTPAPASASTVDSSEATPVPELPIWAMILLCFVGLGLARFKRGRKDRLSPGIE